MRVEESEVAVVAAAVELTIEQQARQWQGEAAAAAASTTESDLARLAVTRRLRQATYLGHEHLSYCSKL